MSEWPLECSICGLTQRAIGGVFRRCAGYVTCPRCWDNLARVTLVLASFRDGSTLEHLAQEILHRVRRAAND